MDFRYKVKLIGTPDLLVKASKRIMKEKLLEIPRLWHSLFLKRHFQPGAAGTYDYRPRSLEYLTRKRRKYGHSIPLVATGLMRRQLQRGIFVRGAASKVRGVMYGPRYVYMKTTAKSNRPAMGEEVTRTTRDEERILGQHLDASVTRAMNECKDSRTVTIG